MIAQTGTALRVAAADAKAAWSRQAWLAIAAFVGLASLPFLLGGSVRLDGLANTGYLALAAVGLGFAVGIGGMPSIAQGAFVGVGAVTAAHLMGSGWPVLAAAVVGAGSAAIGGLLVGAAIVRFRPVYVVAATWIATWLFAIALEAFPSISGGARGLGVPSDHVLGLQSTPTVHYELALALVGLALLGHRALARSSFGVALQGAAQRPAAAAALGTEAPRLRLRAFAGAAAVGGLAGGLAVQLAGVADPEAYGPSLSFQLFVAVLVGGAVSALGPAVGIVFLGGLSIVADALGDVTGADTARFGPMLAAILLLAVLVLGGEGLVPALLGRLGRPPRLRRPPTSVLPHPDGGELAVVHVSKAFGGLVALDRLDLDLRPGRIVALIGPNGSGKTTALRLLSGTLSPDSGDVMLDHLDVTAEPPPARARRGLVRTLQSSAVFPELSVLGNALVGASLRRRYPGALRTLFATPKARREASATEERALAALAVVGLEHQAGVDAGALSGSDQRLLMLAAALATGPRVLLVDEPSAGAGPVELQRLTRALTTLGQAGLTVLVVEHNLRLVRSIADEVVVVDAGRRLASGTPDEVARDPTVRAAYLGRQPL